MADVTVKIPDVSDPRRNGFSASVATIIAAGNNVVIKNEAGSDDNCTHLSLSTAGNVKHRTKSMTDAEANSVYYVAGGWHRVVIHKILASETDASLNIHIKVQDQ